MAFAVTQSPRQKGASVDAVQMGRWSRQLLHLLVTAGAATVIAGSYSTWATFYAGLIARDGVAGHGKFFIGLAVAAVLASLVTSVRGVWGGLRWLAVPAGLMIAAFALRNLRNLDALVVDPAAGFYLPGRGNGLFIVIIGALILALAPLARPVGDFGAVNWVRTGIAAAFVGGVAMLIPGLYGEYYLHFSGGHAHGHTDVLNTAHLLTAGGVLALLAAVHAATLTAFRQRA